MKNLYVIVPVALALTLNSCAVEKPISEPVPRAVEFKASIDKDSPNTRATGTDWDTDDQIGVYMFTKDGTIADNCLSSNVKHVHRGEGFFEAERDEPNALLAGEPQDYSDALYYPQDGSAVNFIAYYPYSETIEGLLYPIDVTDQSKPAAIDFMYSDNAENYTTGTPFLQFYHKLTRLVLNITADEEDTLEGLEATIVGMKTKAAFDLSKGELTPAEEKTDIALRVVDLQEQEAVVEAIVLPDNGIDFVIDFTFADGSVAQLRMEGVNYAESFAYTYNIKVNPKTEAVVIEDSEIVDWGDGGTTDHQIDKRPGDGSGGGEGGEKSVYYEETFDGNGEQGAALGSFTYWSNPQSGVSYSSSSSGIQIKANGLMPPYDRHIILPASGQRNLTISGLPAGYSGIEFTCSMNTTTGTLSAPVRFFVGETEVVPEEEYLLSTSPSDVSIPLPDGTTSLRLEANLTASSAGINIDDITLRGVK